MISLGTMVRVRRAGARTHVAWVGSPQLASHCPLCGVTPDHLPLKAVLICLPLEASEALSDASSQPPPYETGEQVYEVN